LGVTDKYDIAGTTLNKDFLKEKSEDITSENENADFTEENDDDMEED
jgi:hypothetical protein